MGILIDIAQGLNLILILFVLFFERKEDSRRFAWLLTLIFLPGIGMCLYILLSGHFFTRSKQLIKINQYVSSLNEKFQYEQKKFLSEHKSLITNSALKEYLPLIDMNITKSNSLLMTTDNIKIYCWGQDMFLDLKKDLEAATESIHIESFIIHNDKTGSEIMEILCRKARQGISVKLLYDDFGSIRTPASFFRKLNQAGGMSIGFFPIRWRLPLTINFRNHRKITVIDGSIGYMGGVNIGDEYANCSKNKRKPLWRDTHIRITGTSVLALQTVFMFDWFTTPVWKMRLRKLEDISKFFPESVVSHMKPNLSLSAQEHMFQNILSQNHIPTQIITAGPDNIYHTEIEDALIRMIMSAKKYVYIQTPYFTPDSTFINALRIAAYSGVDIRIIVPGKWDKFYVKAAAYEFIRGMSALGITFYQYNGFIHSKMLVSDDKVTTIGSTNIDTRSFELHYEVNAVFYDKHFAEKNRNIFLQDIQNSMPLEKQWFESQCIFRRACWAFFKLFSALM